MGKRNTKSTKATKATTATTEATEATDAPKVPETFNELKHLATAMVKAKGYGRIMRFEAFRGVGTKRKCVDVPKLQTMARHLASPEGAEDLAKPTVARSILAYAGGNSGIATTYKADKASLRYLAVHCNEGCPDPLSSMLPLSALVFRNAKDGDVGGLVMAPTGTDAEHIAEVLWNARLAGVENLQGRAVRNTVLGLLADAGCIELCWQEDTLDIRYPA